MRFVMGPSILSRVPTVNDVGKCPPAQELREIFLYFSMQIPIQDADPSQDSITEPMHDGEQWLECARN
jgi:hypothetical protein